ncbi:MAG: phosphatase PAP2 family protein [Gemmatimonadetes bacterium]|nr:phosphatase PAP2 family protein [Gemmatimonadota bacterium]
MRVIATHGHQSFRVGDLLLGPGGVGPVLVGAQAIEGHAAERPRRLPRAGLQRALDGGPGGTVAAQPVGGIERERHPLFIGLGQRQLEQRLIPCARLGQPARARRIAGAEEQCEPPDQRVTRSGGPQVQGIGSGVLAALFVAVGGLERRIGERPRARAGLPRQGERPGPDRRGQHDHRVRWRAGRDAVDAQLQFPSRLQDRGAPRLGRPRPAQLALLAHHAYSNADQCCGGQQHRDQENRGPAAIRAAHGREPRTLSKMPPHDRRDVRKIPSPAGRTSTLGTLALGRRRPAAGAGARWPWPEPHGNGLSPAHRLIEIGCMRTTILVLLLACAPAAGLQAQETGSAPDSSRAAQPFFTSGDALLAAGFVTGTVALMPADRQLARHIRQPVYQDSRTLQDAASFFNHLGDPGAAIIAPSLYVAGRVAGWPHIAKMGLHGTETIMLASTITSVLKAAFGRARPYLSGDATPDSYAFLRGLEGNQYKSFPSGHATAAFSLAAAVTAESSRWIDEAQTWPGLKVVVGTTMYGAATLVGLARMYDDRHWASDVLAGAAIGTFSGIAVVRYTHRHPGNFIDRWLLSAQVLPAGRGGAVLAWSVPARF